MHVYLMFTAASGPVVAADALIFDMLRALWPVPRHNHADMTPCCNEFACVLCVRSGKWEVGSQHLVYNTKPHGVPTTNEKLLMDTIYIMQEATPYVVLWYVCALRLVNALALLRGCIKSCVVCCDIYFLSFK